MKCFRARLSLIERINPRVIEKTESNLVRSTRAENCYSDEEHEADTSGKLAACSGFFSGDLLGYLCWV